MLQQNPKALEAVWDYAYDKVGYLGTNTPIDHCYACGFEGTSIQLNVALNVQNVAIMILRLVMSLNGLVVI